MIPTCAVALGLVDGSDGYWVGRAPVGPCGPDTRCRCRSCCCPATVVHGTQQAQSPKGCAPLAPSHVQVLTDAAAIVKVWVKNGKLFSHKVEEASKSGLFLVSCEVL